MGFGKNIGWEMGLEPPSPLSGPSRKKKIEAEAGKRRIFRLAKPAFFRYNENFTLGRDFYVAYFVIPEISKNI